MAAEQFDVIVIGAGASGENVAARARRHGFSVVIVESHLVGGECSYWACMPSKALLRPGEALGTVRGVPGAREAAQGDLDVEAVLRFRDEMTSGYDDTGQVSWLEGAGVTLRRGVARLAGERRVRLEVADGTESMLHARRAVVLACGSRSVVPPVDGLAEAQPWTSHDITAARKVPGRLLILGGGVVGVEMAQAWHSLGAEVTIVQRRDRLLAPFEPFAGEQVAAAFTDMGITVRLDEEVIAVRRAGDGGVLTATLRRGGAVTADEVVVAVGRRPRTDDVGLETVGLEPGAAVRVDDQLRATGVPGGWLYAVGDVNGRNLLTHMGKYQARLAADHIAGAAVQAVADCEATPQVVFTDPQVAAVGLTEVDAADRGMDVATITHDIGQIAGASLFRQGVTGTAKLVIDEHRRTVVGATFTGPPVVGELLHAATIAIAGQVPLDRLWHAVPSFPTVSEVWLRLLEGYGM